MDAVLNWLWQGGVVTMATFVMLLALERARANVRYIVCWSAVLLIMALPAIPSLLPSPAPSDALPGTTGDAMLSLPSAWWTSGLVILAAWAVWAGVFGIRFLQAVVAIRRARSRNQAFPSHLESLLPEWRRIQSDGRRATLVISDAVSTAAVLGWGPPIIAVAPALVNTLDANDLDRVLVHEWTHVQRRDDLANIAQVIVRMLAGWHPGLWWLDRRLQIEREIACDEMTIAVTGSPKSYAKCLMTLATRTSTLRGLRMAPGVLRSSDLHARVVKILSPSPSIAPAWSRCLAGAMMTTLCLMSAGVGGLRLVEAEGITLPFVPRLLETPPEPRAAVTVPASSSEQAARRSPRRAITSASSPVLLQTERPSAPAPRTEPAAPATADAGSPVDSARTADADVPSGTTAELPGTVHSVPTASDVTQDRSPSPAAEPSPSPWTTAASGGTALGQKAKNAGVATGGFFSRLGRRVAGSF